MIDQGRSDESIATSQAVYFLVEVAALLLVLIGALTTPVEGSEVDPEFAEQRKTEMREELRKAVSEDNRTRGPQRARVAHWVAGAADAWTTYEGLSTGRFREANPVYAWAIDDRPELVFPMVGLQVWFTNWLARRFGQRWMSWVSAALHTGAAVHNAEAIRE